MKCSFPVFCTLLLFLACFCLASALSSFHLSYFCMLIDSFSVIGKVSDYRNIDGSLAIDFYIFIQAIVNPSFTVLFYRGMTTKTNIQHNLSDPLQDLSSIEFVRDLKFV
ncbi:hypothetical protein F2Q69_00021476 [Brassica cretica]|uniref:Uncharacterized protein n=1 Tax=Brassica cretica TaxID=69181 RepID=A0A8S9QB67_BRACR|nr:hypothetical protein F2Q69_00021476 [Brassica cretica]